jgi:hypothetical protein
MGSFASTARLAPTLIAGELDSTPALRNQPSCFGATFESYALWFTYSDGRPLLIEYSNGGCRSVTNGDLAREFPPLAFTRQLEDALGSDNV